MTKVAETTGTELVDIEKTTAVKAFSDRKAFDKMLADIRKAVKAVQPADGYDMTKKKDRDALRSLAAKIPKVKTKIDEWGAAEVEDMRAKVRDMDALRKEFKDDLDELKAEVRKPLTDWEDAEEKRVDTIKAEMDNIREIGKIGFGETSAEIAERIARLPTHDLPWYQEYEEEAGLVIADVFQRLTQAKTIALNAETEAEKRKADQAELDKLRQQQAESDRVTRCKATIVRIKAIGAGLDPEWQGEGDPTVRELIRTINQIRITPDFQELFDEATDAKDAAVERLNLRLADDIEAEAKKKADADAAEAKQKELDEANQRATDAERRLEEKAAADKAAAETAAAEAETVQRQVEQQSVAQHQAETSAPELQQKKMAEAKTGIAAAIDQAKNRAEAPGLVLAAIIAGRIPNVRFSA